MKNIRKKLLLFLLSFTLLIPFISAYTVKAAYTPDFNVEIKDPELNKALHKKLGLSNEESPIHLYQMSTINYLSIPSSDITDISPLKYCTNLTVLNLADNPKITDFSPIENLTKLVTLNLSGDNISYEDYETEINGTVENIKKINLSNLTNLRVLDLHSTHVSDLKIVESLVNLVSLNCNGAIGDTAGIENLEPLASLTNLQYLYLSNNSIEDLSILAQLEKLVTLHLANNNISTETLDNLSGLTSLVDLDLNNNHIASIDSLLYLYNLEHLLLENNDISDISSISVLRKLETLTLSGNKISNISSLQQLLKLNYLTLSNQRIDLDPVNSENGSLTITNPLYITDEEQIRMQAPTNEDESFSISDGGKEALNDKTSEISWTNLNTSKYLTCTFKKDNIKFHDAITSFNGKLYVPVRVNNPDFSFEDVPKEEVTASDYVNSTDDSYVTIPDNALKFGILKALGKTTLTNEDGSTEEVTEANCQNVNITPYEMSTINYLVLPGCNIKNLNGLQYCINLTTLNLDNNNISDLTYLAGLRSLSTLNLGKNHITNIKALAHLNNLTTLSLFINDVEDISPIKNLTSLTSLYLHHNPISKLYYTSNNKNISYFKNLTNLEILFLGGTGRSNKESNLSDEENLKQISHLTNLTNLDLTDAKISSIEPLRSLTNLTDLNLRINSISDLTPLKSLSNLVRLSLNENKINDITPLQGLKNLKFLRLDCNKINDISPLNSFDSLADLQYLTLEKQTIELDAVEAGEDISIDDPIRSVDNSVITNVSNFSNNGKINDNKLTWTSTNFKAGDTLTCTFYAGLPFNSLNAGAASDSILVYSGEIIQPIK